MILNNITFIRESQFVPKMAPILPLNREDEYYQDNDFQCQQEFQSESQLDYTASTVNTSGRDDVELSSDSSDDSAPESNRRHKSAKR